MRSNSFNYNKGISRRKLSSRRTFLAGAALATGGMMQADQLDAQETDGASYLLQSQALPQPKIVLPTDRLSPPTGKKKRIAAITTTYFKYSHADDIITKFIEGYGLVGRLHEPHCQVVSLYIDQLPPTDIGRGMARRYNIPLFETPAEALTLGGKELAVDGVLLIGEHGDYPLNEKGQKLYPRRKLFEQIVNTFRRTGRAVPVFNDKHLSYSWKNAKWMYDQTTDLDFPLMAGSSVPVAWRRPPLEFRPGIPLETAISAGLGSFESYGFHCLELLQSFLEKRRGGETGVQAVQAIQGEEVLRAAGAGKWPSKLLPAAMAPVPKKNGRQFDESLLSRATVFRIEYADGFEAAACVGGGLVSEFCFAAKIRGREAPAATWCYLPKPPRDHFSFLCNHIEVMFRTGKPSYPVERTLLVTGILDALHDSRAAGGKRIVTQHLKTAGYSL